MDLGSPYVRTIVDFLLYLFIDENQTLLMAIGEPLLINWVLRPLTLTSVKMRILSISWIVDRHKAIVGYLPGICPCYTSLQTLLLNPWRRRPWSIWWFHLQDSFLLALTSERALRFNVDRTKDIRKCKEELFVSHMKGFHKDIAPATISFRIKQTIILFDKEAHTLHHSLPFC